MAQIDGLDLAIRQHAPAVARLLQHSGLREADAEDVLQDVLALFARRFREVDAGARRAFLVATARRAAADARHSWWQRTEFVPLPEDGEGTEPTETEDLLDARDSHRRALEALGVMESHERALFIGARWERRSRQQLAEKHRLAPGTVASRLTRADESFRTALLRIEQHEREQRRQELAWAPWSAPGRRGPSVRSYARAGATLERDGWRFINNQWGRARARGRFEQCLLSRGGPREEIGWSWRWPRGLDGPYGYPQAQMGWSPWIGGPATHPRFPLPLAGTGRLTLDYRVRSHVEGAHLLLAVVYLTHTPSIASSVDPTRIDSEIALLLDCSPEIVPRTPLMRLRLDDAQVEIWRARRWGGKDLSGFPSYVMRRVPGSREGSVDLRVLLTYLEEQRLVDSNLWVASVEFGNEIWGGAGTTWVERLDLSVG